MNSLSWFLYLADVIGNLQGLLVALSLLSGGGLSLWLLFGFISIDSDWDVKKDLRRSRIGDHRKNVFRYLWVPVVFAFAASIIPSRDTIYLIAGSEAGEAVVTSEAGQEILNDIQEVIRYQLGELKGTENKSSGTP